MPLLVKAMVKHINKKKKYEDFEESENIFKQMFREKRSVDCHYMVTRTLNLKFL